MQNLFKNLIFLFIFYSTNLIDRLFECKMTNTNFRLYFFYQYKYFEKKKFLKSIPYLLFKNLQILETCEYLLVN